MRYGLAYLCLFKGIQQTRFLLSPFGFSSLLEDESLSVAACLTTFSLSLPATVQISYFHR